MKQPDLFGVAPSTVDLSKSSAPDTFLEDVAALFSRRPGEWIDGLTVAAVGGAYAWRTRVSECRTKLGMVIENRVRSEGRRKVSEYRYLPAGSADASSKGAA